MKTIGILCLLVGAAFLLIQNTLYGYVDADGVLHDSIFLPFGVFALIIGIFVLVSSGAVTIYRKYLSRRTS